MSHYDSIYQRALRATGKLDDELNATHNDWEPGDEAASNRWSQAEKLHSAATTFMQRGNYAMALVNADEGMRILEGN